MSMQFGCHFVSFRIPRWMRQTGSSGLLQVDGTIKGYPRYPMVSSVLYWPESVSSLLGFIQMQLTISVSVGHACLVWVVLSAYASFLSVYSALQKRIPTSLFHSPLSLTHLSRFLSVSMGTKLRFTFLRAIFEQLGTHTHTRWMYIHVHMYM